MRKGIAILLLVLFWNVGVSHSRESMDSTLLIPVYIEKGTSLIKLARQYCISENHWKDLAEINQLSPPYIIQEDGTIHIPFGLLKKEKAFGEISTVAGDVFWMEKNNSLRQVKKGDRIWPGQTVVTKENGFVHLVLPDRKYIRISSNSIFTLFYLLRLSDQSLKAEFYLKRGNISLEVGEKLKKNETFKTRTPASVTGVQGTLYRVKMDGDVNRVEILRGVVALSAGRHDVKLKAGQGIIVKEGEAPSVPQSLPVTPQLPLLEKVYRTPVLLIPAPVITAGSCSLRLCSDEAGEETVWKGEVGSGEEFMIAALPDDHYFAFFSAINTVGLQGEETGPLRFQLRTTPSAPLMSSGYNGKVVFDSSVDIQWLASQDAENYFVQVARDELFQDIIAEKEIAVVSYQQTGLLPGKYYFRVQAIAEDGFRSEFSRIDSLVIKELPSFGAIAQPEPGESVSLYWSEVGEGSRYDIEIARDEDFASIAADAMGLERAEFLPEPLESGTYYVHVRTVLATGEVSPWSAPQKLTVPPPSFGWVDGVIMAVFLGLMLL